MEINKIHFLKSTKLTKDEFFNENSHNNNINKIFLLSKQLINLVFRVKHISMYS